MISQTLLLKRDMTGPKVSELQQKLQALGFQITVDANFEEETHSRVMEFQSKYGITSDGIVGSVTRNMLKYQLQEMESNMTNKLTTREDHKYPEQYIPFEVYTFQAIEDLIKYFEGKMLESYICPYGKWTIGYGHRGPEVKEGMKITEEQCLELLKKDINDALAGVQQYVKVPLNTNQIEALVSFTFNNGVEELAKSLLLKRLNSGEDPNTVAREEMPRYRYVGSIQNGKTVKTLLNGLVRRRNAEVQHFCTIKKGMSGKEVQLIQEKLSEMKFYTGKIDSYYGSQTEAAVVKIQIEGGLKGSGILDDQTRIHIEREYLKKLSNYHSRL